MYSKETYDSFHRDMKEYNFLAPTLAFKDDCYLNLIVDYPYQSYDPKKDILFLNANEENGVNLYKKFCDKYFLKGMDLKSKISNKFYPLIRMYLKDDGTRGVRFDYFSTFMHFITDPDFYDKLDNYNQLENANYTKEVLIEKRNELRDVLVNKEKSQYYQKVLPSFVHDGNYVNDLSIQKYIDYYSALIMAVNNIKKNISEGTDLKLDEFENCFDLDKLYLIACKVMLDANKPFYEQDKEVTPSFAQVKFYVDAVNTFFGEQDYNPKIKYYDHLTKTIKKYSFRDLRYEYNNIYNNLDHSIFQTIDYDYARKMGLDKIENVNKLKKLLNSEPDVDFMTDWDIIRPGEKDVTFDRDITKSRNLEGQSVEKKVLSVDDIVYRRFTFEKTEYSGKIVGREKFAGYVGYIYPNGLVAFERFYEDDKLTPVKSGNATYIMTIENFSRFTHLDKQKIMEYIKQTDNPDVKRIYHSKNWENRLKTVLNNVQYSDEMKIVIDSILEKYQAKAKTL